MNTDPTRKIGEPLLGMAPVAVVPRSPTGVALFSQYALKIAIFVVGVAAIALELPSMGLALPAGVLTAAGIAMKVGVLLGIGSQGLRTQVGPAPIVQAPRVGPPQ